MGAVAGKTVFITGGARGVGAEVARRLHGKGARLVLTDLHAARLAELAGTLGADDVHTVVADVRDLGAMESAAASAVDRFGGIGIVVANAGIVTYGSVLQVDPPGVPDPLGCQCDGRVSHRAGDVALGDRPTGLRADRFIVGGVRFHTGSGSL